MAWRRFSVPIAFGLGPVIILAAVLRNWHGLASAPFWIDDLSAGVLVLGAAIYAYQDQESLRGRLLTGALGVCVAVLWGSLFESHAGLHPAPESWSLFPGLATAMTLIAMAAALAGLAASLPSSRRPLLGTRPEKQKTRR